MVKLTPVLRVYSGSLDRRGYSRVTTVKHYLDQMIAESGEEPSVEMAANLVRLVSHNRESKLGKCKTRRQLPALLTGFPPHTTLQSLMINPAADQLQQQGPPSRRHASRWLGPAWWRAGLWCSYRRHALEGEMGDRRIRKLLHLGLL